MQRKNLTEQVTIKVELLSKREDFSLREVSANVLQSQCVPASLQSPLPHGLKTSYPHTLTGSPNGSQQFHTGQLRCRGFTSAILYRYLLIGGTVSHFIEDEGDVFYLPLAH